MGESAGVTVEGMLAETARSGTLPTTRSGALSRSGCHAAFR